MKSWCSITAAGVVLCSAISGRGSTVGMIDINGAIGPATADYVMRATDVAAKQGSECLIIRLDTPGGLLDSTKSIVQSLYQSVVPVVVYVTPSGATATSAGCFITLAADVAAMAPNTSIGAAHPVSIGGLTGGGDEKPDAVMNEKLENYAVSYIETIAQKRQRNVQWAKDSVRKSASITAEKARELKVIEIIARDEADLLTQLQGRSVRGKMLQTAEAKVVEIPMLLREQVFQQLWRPEVMFLLMLIAMYGIIGELSNPGALLPGITGAVALILALYMSAILPVNAAGLALMGLAILLFVTDVFAPTHGLLTSGGVIAFLLGSLMLFDKFETGLRLSLGVIVPAALITAAFFIFVVGAGLRAQFLPVTTGMQTMIGQTIPAHTAIDASGGSVFIEGELWQAQSSVPIAVGQPVKIDHISGLTLHVIPSSA